MPLSVSSFFLYDIFMKKYPDTIPVFPLSGVIYFPKTNLPLNIFEERYLKLVNDAYNNDKLMGMVQSKKGNDSVYDVGCLGKISNYQKIKDGRIMINLTGLTRFNIIKESDQSEIDASGLIDKAKPFFKKNGLLLNWKEFEKLNQTQKINTLSMISPITNEEKQKLLEAISLESKVRTLESIFSFYLHETSFNNFTIQ